MGEILWLECSADDTVLQVGSAWFFGARFDLAYEQLRSGNLKAPGTHEEAQKVMAAFDGRKDEL